MKQSLLRRGVQWRKEWTDLNAPAAAIATDAAGVEHLRRHDVAGQRVDDRDVELDSHRAVQASDVYADMRIAGGIPLDDAPLCRRRRTGERLSR